MVTEPSEWTELLRRQAGPRTGLHVTDLLACPRKKAGLEAGWPVQLDRLEDRLLGSIAHSALATVNPESAEIPVVFGFAGLQIVGSIDRLVDGRVIDYKRPGEEDRERGKKARKPDGPYPEQVWQAEMYRFGLAQMDSQTDGWTIWIRESGRWVGFEHTGDGWTEAELLDFRPSGSAMTVRDVTDFYKNLGPDTRAEDYQLTGLTMKVGNKMACDYCEIQEACMVRAGKAF